MEKAKRFFGQLVGSITSQWPYILAAFLIVAAVLVVYWNDFRVLADEAMHSEAASHILLVPFFVGFLLYRRRALVKARLALEQVQTKQTPKYLDEALGVALFLVAFLLYWYGSYTFAPLMYHLLSLPIFVAGTVLLLLGLRPLRLLAFPILFLLFLIPPPGDIMYSVGGVLATVATEAAHALLQTLGLPVTLQWAYGSPVLAVVGPSGEPISFAVNLACSGFYTLIAFLMLATFLAFIARGSLLTKAGIFALGIPVFAIANIARITAIVLIGYGLGEGAAMSVFHTVAGWLFIFAGMLVILLVAEKAWHIHIIPPSLGQPCATCDISARRRASFCTFCGRFLQAKHERISTRLWAKLVLLLLASYGVTAVLQAPTFVLAQGPAQATANVSWENATLILPEIPHYSLQFLYRDTHYENVAGQDASLLYAYTPVNTSARATVYAEIGVADTISNLHNWEICLITWQTAQGRSPTVTVLDERDFQLLPDAPLIARYLVFQHPAGYTQVTLYWYEQATFRTSLTVEQKYVRISLLILTQNQTSYPALEAELLPLAQTIAAYWEPMKSQALISLGVPMQQALLGLAIGFVAATSTADHAHAWRKKTTNLRLFSSFATHDEKAVLQALQALNQQMDPVQTRHIADALADANIHIENEDLNAILHRLEALALIRKAITIIHGQPVQTWKA